MSLAVRMVGLDAREEIIGLGERKYIGDKYGVIQKGCFERKGDVLSESEACEGQTFEHVTNC